LVKSGNSRKKDVGDDEQPSFWETEKKKKALESREKRNALV